MLQDRDREVSADQIFQRYPQTSVQVPDHPEGELPLAVQHLVDPIRSSDVRDEIGRISIFLTSRSRFAFLQLQPMTHDSRSSLGSAPTSSFVYSARGEASTSRAFPVSTIRPR